MRVLGLKGMGSVPARFCVTNPLTARTIPARKITAPNIQRIGACAKLVGKNHSSASAAMMGKTNRSGGAIGTPGRSSSGGKSQRMSLSFDELVQICERSAEDIQIVLLRSKLNKKSEGRLR